MTKKTITQRVKKCLIIIGLVAVLSPLVIILLGDPIEQWLGPFEPSLAGILLIFSVIYTLPFGIVLLIAAAALHYWQQHIRRKKSKSLGGPY